MIARHIPMFACGISLPALLYLILVNAGPKITPEPDRWLLAFRTVQPQALPHSTSREIEKHYLHKRVRKFFQGEDFAETRLQSYRVAEAPVQVITFPSHAPLDDLIEDGAEEYKSENFRTRRYKVCRSGRNLFVIHTITSGSTTGRHKVPAKVIRKIMNAFQKEAARRGYSKD